VIFVKMDSEKYLGLDSGNFEAGTENISGLVVTHGGSDGGSHLNRTKI